MHQMENCYMSLPKVMQSLEHSTADLTHGSSLTRWEESQLRANADFGQSVK